MQPAAQDVLFICDDQIAFFLSIDSRIFSISTKWEICPLGKEIEPPPPEDARRIETTELLKRQWLSKNAFEIQLSRPESFAFEAGQTISFIHQSIERYYSLLSTPDDPFLALCVYRIPNGQFSPILADAEIGARFKFSGPHGYFTFKPSSRQAVFVACGTGIAPFVSMSRSGVTDFMLLHEVSRVEDLYYQNIIDKMTSNYVPCLLEAVSAEPSPPGAFLGDAASYLIKNLQPGSYDFYLCGEREMIRGVTLLVDEHFAGSYVYTEVFY
jgi:ferredoxin-NADP reductase